jgi:hypothetical protein
MTEFETRAAARLQAAVRKTLEEGQLGADAAPVIDLPPRRCHAGRDAHAIAVHGDGNVIYVGGAAAPRAPTVPPGRRWRPSRLLVALVLIIALLMAAAAGAMCVRWRAQFFKPSVAFASGGLIFCRPCVVSSMPLSRSRNGSKTAL